MPAPFEDRLARFAADGGDQGYTGILIGGSDGPTGLATTLAVEQRERDVFFDDAAGQDVEPDEATEFGWQGPN